MDNRQWKTETANGHRKMIVKNKKICLLETDFLDYKLGNSSS